MNIISKKWWLIPFIFILLLIALNPTYSDFKEYAGISDPKYSSRKANFLILSIYEESSHYPSTRYLGIAKNFIKISSRTIDAVQNVNSFHPPIDSVLAVRDTVSAKPDKIPAQEIHLEQIINLEGLKIGSQIWLKKNLDISAFRNGDIIPEAKSSDEWVYAGKNHQPAWCYYNNDSSCGTRYGKLYNGYAINDLRGLAPNGWHIPKKEEWETLAYHIMSSKYTQFDVGKFLKSKQGWKIETQAKWDSIYSGMKRTKIPKNANGTDKFGFTAFPAGYRDYNGIFSGEGKNTYWAIEDKANETFGLSSYFNSIEFSELTVIFDQKVDSLELIHKNFMQGFSVRFVKD